jgi:hypothetical protein
MRRFFKRQAESDLGMGVVYLEFDGEWATRQVENYGGQWFRSDREFHAGLGPALCDQPLTGLELSLADEISQEEFERAWVRAAIKVCP